MSKKINETLLELILGILTAGGVIQIGDLLVTAVSGQFRGMRALFASGLWAGILIAVILAAHMYRSIDRALDMQPAAAESYMRRAYLVRTVIILLAAAGVRFFRIGYVMAYFVGVLCLKFGAFLQPLVHKFREKLRK